MAEYQDTFMRIEKKYLLDAGQYAALSRALDAHMTRDQFGLHTICNLYFDTPDYALIRRSLDKPIYKEKLRLRSYGMPTSGDTVFLEIKKKFKGVVYKRRVGITPAQADEFMANGAFTPEFLNAQTGVQRQIACEINWFEKLHCAQPMAFIAYDRVALFAPDTPGLRVTFDRDIRWRGDALRLDMPPRGRLLFDPGTTLMEIKIPGALPLWLSHALTRLGIFPTSFSKYGECFINFVLHDDVRQSKGSLFSA